MTLLGFSYHLMPRRDQRGDMSLGMIRTHVSRVAPDWEHLKNALPTELQHCGLKPEKLGWFNLRILKSSQMLSSRDPKVHFILFQHFGLFFSQSLLNQILQVPLGQELDCQVNRALRTSGVRLPVCLVIGTSGSGSGFQLIALPANILEDQLQGRGQLGVARDVGEVLTDLSLLEEPGL